MKKSALKLFTIILSLGFLICSLTTELYARTIVNSGIFSEETQQWLDWFNSLPYDLQVLVNHRPSEIVEYRASNSTILPELKAIDAIDGIQIETSMIIREGQGGIGLAVGGYELAYNPNYWNGTRIKKANCYYYVVNVVSSSTVLSHQQPGYKANATYSALVSSNIFAAMKKDVPYFSNVVSIRSSSASEKAGVNEYKIALVIAPGLDYHFYRQNPDGTWSHKQGHKEVKLTDASGKIIYTPQGCDKNYGNGLNYSIFAGYYIVKYA